MATKPLTDEQKEARRKTREANLAKQEEARLKDLRDSELKRFRSQPIPMPRYTYKVGDKVLPRAAGWNFLIVKEVLDEGKILLCEVDHTENNYGNPYVTKKLTYVTHLDIIPENLKKAPAMAKDHDRAIAFTNMELMSLITFHYSQGMDYSPVYQRELCWETKDKEALIHSIFNNIEIGKFALIERGYDREDGPAFEVLDGKQRINAIIGFYEDQFPYKGVYFSELDRKDIRKFLHSNITLGRGSDEMTLAQKMEYFLEMNSAGVPQDPKHLEKVSALLKKEVKK